MIYLFVVILFIVSFVLRSPKVKGTFGEGMVRNKLRKLDPQTYIAFHDLLLPNLKSKTSQIDHVVVSPFGLFVIETKNYKGWITGKENSQQWAQTIYKRKEKFYNPIWQNKGHIHALQELLQEVGDIPYFSIIAFSPRCDLKVDVQTDVVYFSQLNRTIQKYRQVVLTEQQMANICEILGKANLVDKRSKKDHVARIKNNQKATTQKINQGVCPKCGGTLVARNGKYGTFLGCTGYPKCKFRMKNAR